MSKSEIKFFLSRFVSKYKLRRALRELAYGLITLLVMSISLTELSARNVILIDEAADKNPDSIEACDKQKKSAPESVYAKSYCTCLEPQEAIATANGLTSIILSWTTDSHNSTNDYLIEYGPEGFILGDGTVTVHSSTTMTVRGLSHTKTYDFYISADCGSGDLSLPYKVTGTTFYPAFSIPFTEDFDSVQYKDIPSYWSRFDKNHDYNSSFTFKRFGASKALWNYSANSSPALYVGGTNHSSKPMNDWLVTPRLDLIPNQKYIIKFRYTGVNSSDRSSHADLEVFLGNSTGISTMDFSIGEVRITGTKSSEFFSAEFIAPAFDSYHIGFQAKKKSKGFVAMVVIDDISVTESDNNFTVYGIKTPSH